MAAHAANPDRDGKTLCRFIMGDLLEWSTKLDDPAVHAERAALSAAYARLAGAVYSASTDRRQAFLNVYPPYEVVTRKSLDIVETAYPHKVERLAERRTPANDAQALAATAPTLIDAKPKPKPTVDAAAPTPRGGRFGLRLPLKGKGERPDPRLHWIDPRDGRKLG